MQRVGRARFCGPLEEFHSVVYEARDEDELQRDLPILEVVFNLRCHQLLFRSLELVDFLPSVSIQGFNELAVKLSKSLSDFEPATREAFLVELDKIADANRRSFRSDSSRLDKAIKFAGPMLSFRLRVVVIQLLAQSLIAAFRGPKAQLINEVEDALSDLAKSFVETKAGGRKSLRDGEDPDAFRNKLREKYCAEMKRRRRRPTQEEVATRDGSRS